MASRNAKQLPHERRKGEAVRPSSPNPAILRPNIVTGPERLRRLRRETASAALPQKQHHGEHLEAERGRRAPR